VPLDILMVAGEASADLHGASLVRELRELQPEAHFFGVGGQQLVAEGMEVCIPAERLNVVGGADWADKVADVLRAYRSLKQEITRRRPAVAVLLDLPDFNLRLARFLKRQGIPVVYYISPQVWAWRKYRVNAIRRRVDRMLVVFPFEKKFYDKHGVKAEFVGHPLLEQVSRRSKYRAQPEVLAAPRIALLPGSRPSELRYHAPLLRELAVALKKLYPNCELRVPVASTLTVEEVDSHFAGAPVEVLGGDSRQTIEWADIAAVASGTATLETAIIGTPFCLFYRMSRSTSWVIRHLIRYRRFFGMPNLLHGKEVVREFLHDKATVHAILRECRWMIEDERYRVALADQLAACRTLLGDPGASRRAALSIFSVVRKTSLSEATLVPASV
jgi:lipid-A-disaccharide synthase